MTDNEHKNSSEGSHEHEAQPGQPAEGVSPEGQHEEAKAGGEEKVFGETTKETAKEVSKESRNMAVLCHLLGLFGIIGPLIIWLLKKEEDWFVDDQGREAVNYHISLIIYYLVSWILCFVLIGFLLLFVLGILHLVFVIMAALKAGDGKLYRYPIAIRFIK